MSISLSLPAWGPTVLLLDDPLGDLVQGGHLAAEFVGVILHGPKLLGPGPDAPHRYGRRPHRVPHPAQEAGTLLLDGRQVLVRVRDNVRAGWICS